VSEACRWMVSPKVAIVIFRSNATRKQSLCDRNRGDGGALDRGTPRCYEDARLECPQPRSPFQVVDRHVHACGNGRIVQKWVPFRGWEKQALPSCLLLSNCPYIRSLTGCVLFGSTSQQREGLSRETNKFLEGQNSRRG